jgi:hypothetical protein
MPEGIYRVRIITNRLAFLSFLGLYAAAGLAAFILPPVIWFIFAAAIVYGFAFFGLRWLGERRRRAIGVPPSPEILENQKQTTKIVWDDVKSVSLLKRRNLRMYAGVRAYRASFRSEDYEELKSFLASKIGDRLSAVERAS